MKNIFTFTILLITMKATGQQINKTQEDQLKHQQIIIGECSRDGITSFPEFKKSYKVNYEHYKPDSTTIIQLKDAFKGKKIKVVLGTWCGDSKLQVPHFLKIIDNIGVDANDIEFVSVDGNKHVSDESLDNLEIERIPTFIFFDKNRKEMGRIVESPKESLEKDILKMINGNKTK